MSGGWTVVDTASNKSLPVGGSNNSGTGVPYVSPAPSATDPVQKFRISAPQSLIDTDFEYGTQPTKWETISLQNNRQSCYYIPQQPLAVTSILGTGTSNVATLQVASSITIANNTPIYIQNGRTGINGWSWIQTGGTGTTFTVILDPTTALGNGTQYFVATSCYVYLGYFYSACGINVGTNAITVTSATVLTVTSTQPHGLTRGSLVYLNSGAIGGGATRVAGAYTVETIPTATTFTLTTSGSSGTPTNSPGNNVVYARPAGYVEPRSFDGGVAFSAGASVPNQQLIRQTRRYFRYQSGKGIQFSTGSSLKPALFVSQIYNSTGTVVVTTRYNHNLTVGTTIQVAGCNQGYFNGNFVVSLVFSPTVFWYSITGAPTALSEAATGQFRVSPLNWYGATSRIGFTDQQNGMFFEFDGTTLYTVLRNSTNQISGTASVTNGSCAVVGDSQTAFTTQLVPGQFIVIRGQTYRINQIVDDQNMFILPEYRGTTIAGAIISQTLEVRTPQSQWLDKCDGTGPSGYNMDLTRMQMWYIDYSWYGAGFIRFGVRGTNGIITYVNQIQNNNRQFEAYMRSGNMAGHYEVSGVPPITYLAASLSNSFTTLPAAITVNQTTIAVNNTGPFNSGGGVAIVNGERIFYITTSTPSGAGNLLGCTRGFGGSVADDQTSGSVIRPDSMIVANSSGFPNRATGGATLQVKVQDQLNQVEYISYTGITNTNIIWGLTRGAIGGGSSVSFGTGVQTSVELASPDSVPSLSHWGSSAIMDGRFDDDKSLIFNYGTVTPVGTSSTTPVVLLAIRIAPAVDNGTTGLLGAKEIINRMQLQLDSLGIVTTGNTYLINLVLNGYASGAMSGGFVAPIQQTNGITSSLAQIATNTNNVTVTGGESVAAAFCQANGVTTLDLSQVRDLGNSILGGGTTNIVPTSQFGFYPDGPDILYVVAQAISATAGTILARLSWKEAQA